MFDPFENLGREFLLPKCAVSAELEDDHPSDRSSPVVREEGLGATCWESIYVQLLKAPHFGIRSIDETDADDVGDDEVEDDGDGDAVENSDEDAVEMNAVAILR